MKNKIKIVQGSLFILISIWVYFYVFISRFLYGSIFQLYEILLMSFFFIFGIGLTFIGIFILRSKIETYTYLMIVISCLIIGSLIFEPLYRINNDPFVRFMRRDYKGAIKILSRKIREGDSYKYSDRGQIYYVLGEYEKAVRDFENLASRLDTKHLILAHVKLKNFKEAFKICNREFSQYKEEPIDAYYWRGQIYFRSGDYALAIAEYEKIIIGFKYKYLPGLGDNSKEYYSPFVAIAICYAKLGDTTKALEYFSKAIEAVNSNIKGERLRETFMSDILTARGDFYFYIKDFENALKDYDEAIRLYFTNEALLGRIYVLISKGNYYSALRDIYRIIGESWEKVYYMQDLDQQNLDQIYKLLLFIYKKLNDKKGLAYINSKYIRTKSGMLPFRFIAREIKIFESFPRLFNSFEERIEKLGFPIE